MIVPKIQTKAVSQFLLKIDNFRGGVNTLVNPSRLKTTFATEVNNLYQVQDGIWKTRPGLTYYGKEITGVSSIDGACEFEKADGTRELIAIAGGFAWKSKDGGSWSQISGATFTANYKPYFIQIGSKLFISNGNNTLSVYNGSSLSTYAGISDPANAPSGSRTGLTEGAYYNYYRIVAVNEIGTTLPSPALEITTNKPREQWDSSNYLTLSWTAVSGADGYQIYWGEQNGFETYITETTTNSFTDYGEVTYPHNPYIETPDDNTTAAPKFRTMTISGNRLWATGDTNNKWRVYFTGTGKYFLNPAFSPFYGGGWIDLEKGGKNKPISLAHYRTGKGDPIITVFCTSADGQGTIFQIDLTSVTIGDISATVPAAYKIVGAIGADAPYSVVPVYDNVFFVNKRGVFALRNKEQMFNVLSNDDMTAPIRNKFESINKSKIENVVGYFKTPRLYYSIPIGDDNDTTIIFDYERSNWTWKWDFGARQFLEYTDSDGLTHFLIVPTSGNQLIEISENATSDLGEPFYQLYVSPVIPIDKDYTTMAKIKEVIYELGSFRGSVILEVIGITKDRQITTLATKQISSTTGTSGIGDDFLSDMFLSDTTDSPSIFVADAVKKVLKLGKKLYAIQFMVYTTSNNTSFELLGIQAKGYAIPKRAPSSWKN